MRSWQRAILGRETEVYLGGECVAAVHCCVRDIVFGWARRSHIHGARWPRGQVDAWDTASRGALGAYTAGLGER